MIRGSLPASCCMAGIASRDSLDLGLRHESLRHDLESNLLTEIAHLIRSLNR